MTRRVYHPILTRGQGDRHSRLRSIADYFAFTGNSVCWWKLIPLYIFNKFLFKKDVILFRKIIDRNGKTINFFHWLFKNFYQFFFLFHSMLLMHSLYLFFFLNICLNVCLNFSMFFDIFFPSLFCFISFFSFIFVLKFQFSALEISLLCYFFITLFSSSRTICEY